MSSKMKNFLFIFVLLSLASPILKAQNIDFDKDGTLGNLFIRMYGELHYYQPVNTTTFQQGKFDAKRMVALFGYQFNRNTQFVTEWELEHGNEIFLEQGFIKHKIAGNTTIKAGMILLPMGLVNEYHEPNNFYSVDRPYIDRNLVPTTWRDIGIGLNGIFPSNDIKYQIYLVNGLLGYKSGEAKFNAASNFRSGRQKGIKTIMSGLPAVSGQLEYFGFTNGKIGLSIYSGKSNTDAYTGIERSNKALKSVADSTTVYTNMVGLHGSFDMANWTIRGQVIYSKNENVEAYRAKTGSDLGASSFGTYLEAGRPFTKNGKWIAFARYSYIDSVLDEVIGNDNMGVNHIITTGINYKAAEGAIFKIDGQWTNIHENPSLQINTGIGVWF